MAAQKTLDDYDDEPILNHGWDEWREMQVVRDGVVIEAISVPEMCLPELRLEYEGEGCLLVCEGGRLFDD